MKTCGFCGGSGQSQEHLWPERIRKLVIETRGEDGKRYLVEHERHGMTTRFQSTKLATKIGMPCQSCNNGWNRVELMRPITVLTIVPPRILRGQLGTYVPV